MYVNVIDPAIACVCLVLHTTRAITHMFFKQFFKTKSPIQQLPPIKHY